MAKKSFYEVGSYTGDLQEGIDFSVHRQMRYLGENANFKPFLNTPIKELEQQLKESKAAEKKIFTELQTAAKAWDAHGARTLLLTKAIEYLKTPVVENTGNEWKQRKDGSWEISNLVYKMTFSIVKFRDEWKLSWELQYTAPGLAQVKYRSYYDQWPKKRIEYEGSKKYKTMAGAQKYIQSKFDQYAEYFESVSPPIPIEAKALFCVNGQLLQGYFIMRTSPKKEEVTLNDLLDCLEEQDLEGPPPEQAAPSEGKIQPEPPAQTLPEQAAPIKAEAPAKPPGERPAEPPREKKAPPAKPTPAAKKKGPVKKRPALVR